MKVLKHVFYFISLSTFFSLLVIASENVIYHPTCEILVLNIPGNGTGRAEDITPELIRRGFVPFYVNLACPYFGDYVDERRSLLNEKIQYGDLVARTLTKKKIVESLNDLFFPPGCRVDVEIKTLTGDVPEFKAFIWDVHFKKTVEKEKTIFTGEKNLCKRAAHKAIRGIPFCIIDSH